MNPKRTGAPAAEPWTLAEAKEHLKIDGTDQDLEVAMMLTAAREHAEEMLQRTLVSTPWLLTLDEFPCAIKLHMPPIISVSSVRYIDEAGILQTLDPADYLVDTVSSPGYVVPGVDKSWPATQKRINAVTVQYTAGYGATAANVPMPIRWWIKLQMGAMNANRDAESAVQTYALGNADRLLDHYKVWGM